MIYVTGDIHGDMNRFKQKSIKKLKHDDTLIVCGDFGFIWDGSKQEEKMLNALQKYSFQILFLDGSHENFDLLNKYPIVDFRGGHAQHICGRIYHLMRGEIYEIEGKKIFTFGGGEDPDKDIRIEMGTWFKEELPSEEEINSAIDNLEKSGNKVDYVITHQPPENIKVLLLKENLNKNVLDSFFDKLSKDITYKKWFSGCLHIDKKVTQKQYALFNDIVAVEQRRKRRFFKS